MTATTPIDGRKFDLEDRTYNFAQNTRLFLKILPEYMKRRSDYDQLMRSSGSVGANYIEANEAISKRDFVHRIKICRKEAKESRYWLRLIKEELPLEHIKQCEALIQEAYELLLIFNATVRSAENRK